MIDSEKLSELLSSKKKHRYQEVKDSMDENADMNIHQHIDFTDEEENLQIHEYHSPGVESPEEQQSILQNDQDPALYLDQDIVEDHIQPEQEIINPEKEFIIESMTYQQIQEEQNNIIEEGHFESENQTVINCTQSDQEESSFAGEERISDKNIIDDSSLEYAATYENGIGIPEAIPEEPSEPIEEIREERVF